MFTCYICNKNNYLENGFNPWPLCKETDYDLKCCSECNSKYIIKARMIMHKNSDKVNVGDTVVIFYSSITDEPVSHVSEYQKFLTGIVEEEVSPNHYIGSWGDFELNTKEDNYAVIK